MSKLADHSARVSRDAVIAWFGGDLGALVRRSSFAVQISIGATMHNFVVLSSTYVPSYVYYTSGMAH